MNKQYKSATQDWLLTIPVMQQTVLLSGIRGMDGLRKLHPAKALVRYYRRCVLISAFDGCALDNPWSPGGGDFTGPSMWQMPDGTSDSGSKFGYDNGTDKFVIQDAWELMRGPVANDFIRARDEMPLHYFSHMMHAFQIVGAHHPNNTIRRFWYGVYLRMVHALHLLPEPLDMLDSRLGDTETGWRAREDAAGSCST